MLVHCTYDELADIDSLKPHPQNRNKHPGDQIKRLADVLNYQGWRYPIKVSKRSGFITSGHGRIEAAKYNGWDKVPVNYQYYESYEQEYADVQSDNAIASWAELDLDEIKADLKDLPDFNIDLLGIKDFSIDDGFAPREDDDDIPDIEEGKDKTSAGDLIVLGEHRLLCGDSTDKSNIERLMGREKADMVFTSPPYNVGKVYNSYNDLKNDKEYFVMISDILKNCFNIMNNGRMIAWNVGVSPKSSPYNHALLMEECGFKLYRHIIWKKTGCQIPLWQNSKKNPYARYYMPNYNHEMIYLMRKGEIERGEQTIMPDEISMDVWDISQFSAGGKGHPAAFPVKLVENAIYVMSSHNEKVFEPFGGSGSTIIACEKTDRKCFMMEIDEHYCDVIITRYCNYVDNDVIIINGKEVKWSEYGEDGPTS